MRNENSSVKPFGFVLLVAAAAFLVIISASCHDVDDDDDQFDSGSSITQGQWFGQKWRIDGSHMMFWEDEPYIPYGAFATEPGNPYNLDFANVWIDGDFFAENGEDATTADHIAHLNEGMDDFCQAGIGVLLQFSIITPETLDASTLFNAEVRSKIITKWAEYAEVAMHPCLRGITLWNEINVEWQWPPSHSAKQYGEILSEYADEMRALLADNGQVPILFKTATNWNAAPVIEGAKRADGLLVDVWPIGPGDPWAAWVMKDIWEMFEENQIHTTWYLVGEGGKGAGGDGCVENGKYWDNWPPFLSESEALGIFVDYAHYGLKGIIYNGPFTTGPTESASCSYEQSFEYLRDIKSEVVNEMVQTDRNVDFSNAPNSDPGIECGELPQCIENNENGQSDG